MAMTGLGTRAGRGGIDIELFNSNCAHIRSNWPVTSPRGTTSIDTKLLSAALEEGVEAKRDTQRASFFEVDVGHSWFYFHIAHKLGRIYLVAAFVV
ncbi:MAG TPA: hypothetical protein VER98_12495 [Terriglobia bacterium]|nr:hypothetical protein [Terriglobia bacterium]